MSRFYKDIAGDQYEVLAKAIYRKELGQVTDPLDLYLPLLALPRSLLSWLVQKVKPLAIDESKELDIPGTDCKLHIRKITDDAYRGQITKNNKIIHSFDPTTLPAVGGHILNVCELYDEVAGREVEETEKKELIDKMSEKDELKSIVEKLGKLVDAIVSSQVKKEELAAQPEKQQSQQPVVVNVNLSNIGTISSLQEEKKELAEKQPEKPKEIPVKEVLDKEQKKTEESKVEGNIPLSTTEKGPGKEGFLIHTTKEKQDKKLQDKKPEELKKIPKSSLPASRINDRLKKKRELLQKKSQLVQDSATKVAPMQPQARTPQASPVKGNTRNNTMSMPTDTAAPLKQISRTLNIKSSPKLAGGAGIKQSPQPKQPKIPVAQQQMKQAIKGITKEELDSAKTDDGKPMFIKDVNDRYVFNPSGVHAVMTKDSMEIKKNEDGTFSLFVNGKQWDKENLELLTQMIKLRSLIKNWGF